MPFCRICGAALDSGARFCRLCGTSIEPQSQSVALAQPGPISQFNQNRYSQKQVFRDFRLSESQIEILLFPGALLLVLIVKLWLSLQYRISIWDSYVYLLNARTFFFARPLSQSSFFELLRPPAFPYIISLIWHFTGVSYFAAAYISPIYTIASAFIFYLLLKKMFGLKPAFVGGLLLAIAPEVFLWTNQILVHGEVLFFIVAAVYFLWRGIQNNDKYSLPLAGGALALATLTRYTILLLVPVFLVILIVFFFESSRKRLKYPWANVCSMALVFVIAWIPWLIWNYQVAGNPLASLLAGLQFISGSAEPWYFFIVNMPLLLTVPGCALLVIGLIDSKTVKDRGRLVLLFWLATFFIFSSIIQHKETRYIIDFAPPLVAFATLGICRIEAKLPSRTKIVAWILIAIWLSATFYPAVSSSFVDAKNRELDYGSYGEFVTLSNWVIANTNKTTIAATDIPTALSFQTDRYFYSIEYLLSAAQERRMPVNQLMSDVGVKILIIRKLSDYETMFAHNPSATPAKQFPSYLVYTFNCLNCTKRT